MSTLLVLATVAEKPDLFNSNLAREFGVLSKLAYIRFEENGGLLVQPLAMTGFSALKTIHNKTTGTQAMLVRSKDYAVLVFRGTEPDCPEDLSTDINANLDSGWHSGFITAYNSIKNEIEDALALIDEGTPLYVTGHSLGGALAKIAALHLQSRISQCYTYGSPAVCTKDIFGNNKVPVFVIVNNGDIVPRATFLAPIIVPLLSIAVSAFHALMRLINPKFKSNDIYIEKLKTLLESTKQLQHFGTILILDELGNFNSNSQTKDFLDVFWKVVSKDYKQTAQEHSIDAYIKKLSRADRLIAATIEQTA